MSFDVDDFIGLVRGGAAGAPGNSEPEYGWSSFAEDGLWVVGADNFISCEEPTPLPGSGTVFRDWPAETTSVPATYSRPISGFHGFTHDLGDVTRPPDYITLHIEISPSLSAPDVFGFYATCAMLVDNGDGTYSGGGPGSFVDPEFRLSADMVGSGGTPVFEVESGGDGDNGPLKGYLRRPSVAYTGDAANTASDYLWPFAEVDEMAGIISGGDFVAFHKAEVTDIVFTVRAFWRGTPIVCLV